MAPEALMLRTEMEIENQKLRDEQQRKFPLADRFVPFVLPEVEKAPPLVTSEKPTRD